MQFVPGFTCCKYISSTYATIDNKTNKSRDETFTETHRTAQNLRIFMHSQFNQTKIHYSSNSTQLLQHWKKVRAHKRSARIQARQSWILTYNSRLCSAQKDFNTRTTLLFFIAFGVAAAAAARPDTQSAQRDFQDSSSWAGARPRLPLQGERAKRESERARYRGGELAVSILSRGNQVDLFEIG